MMKGIKGRSEVKKGRTLSCVDNKRGWEQMVNLFIRICAEQGIMLNLRQEYVLEDKLKSSLYKTLYYTLCLIWFGPRGCNHTVHSIDPNIQGYVIQFMDRQTEEELRWVYTQR